MLGSIMQMNHGAGEVVWVELTLVKHSGGPGEREVG